MPKDIYYVYTYYDPRNGDPIYVGLGKNNRAFKHWKKKANNVFFQNVLNKIRAQGLCPRIEFVSMGLSFNEACALEKQMISLFGRRDLGKGTLCNLTDGGDGTAGYVRSEKSIEATRAGVTKYWAEVDHKAHGKRIAAVFSARTEKELAVVSSNIKASRTSEVRAKIGKSTKERMKPGEFKEKVLASLQTKSAREKRKASLKAYSNTDEGRENRRRAANIRWEKERSEKQLLLSNSCSERN